MGHPVVSLRKFLNNILWGRITELQKSREAVDVSINETIKGGMLVSTDDGISGFLPNSQTSFARSNENIKVKAIILEADRTTGKIIFSQSQSVTSADFIKSAKQLKSGNRIKVTVSNITSYGIFVSVPVDGNSIDGFIHISEISWEKVEDISDQYAVGDEIEAEIIGFDQEARRVNLSIRKLAVDPFDEKMKDYPVDKKVTGKIKEIKSQGIIVDLGDNLEALIKKEKVPPQCPLSPETVLTL